jgi:hypothetical protein
VCDALLNPTSKAAKRLNLTRDAEFLAHLRRLHDAEDSNTASEQGAAAAAAAAVTAAGSFEARVLPVARAVELALSGVEAGTDRFAVFGVFPDDAYVPEAVIAAAWHVPVEAVRTPLEALARAGLRSPQARAARDWSRHPSRARDWRYACAFR